jgi:putative membrane protein
MSKRSNPFALAALAGLLALAPVLAQSNSKSSLNPYDKKFVWNAAVGGMEEVQLGQLAVQKASNADVKNFGQRMVDDHSKANDQLKSIASQKGVTLPTNLPPDKKKDVNKLSKLSGAAFDREYMSMMVKDHKKDVSEFEKESKQAKDSDLKSFAQSTLPILRDHLKMAEDTHSKLHNGTPKKGGA